MAANALSSSLPVYILNRQGANNSFGKRRQEHGVFAVVLVFFVSFLILDEMDLSPVFGLAMFILFYLLPVYALWMIYVTVVGIIALKKR